MPAAALCRERLRQRMEGGPTIARSPVPVMEESQRLLWTTFRAAGEAPSQMVLSNAGERLHIAEASSQRVIGFRG